ncbi:hypothetical protein CYMTET_34795, partial [Cymbomonas tetramitiformis]
RPAFKVAGSLQDAHVFKMTRLVAGRPAFKMAKGLAAEARLHDVRLATRSAPLHDGEELAAGRRLLQDGEGSLQDAPPSREWRGSRCRTPSLPRWRGGSLRDARLLQDGEGSLRDARLQDGEGLAGTPRLPR